MDPTTPNDPGFSPPDVNLPSVDLTNIPGGQAVTDAVNNAPDFVHRLVSDLWRLGIAVLVVLIVWGAISKGNSGPVTSKIVTIATPFAALGSFWLAWYVYNIWAKDPQPLFVGESSPSTLWQAVYGQGYGLLAAAVGIFLGIWIAVKAKGFITGILAGIGTWAGVMLLYSLVFVQILGVA